MKAIRNVRGEEKTLPVAPSVPEQVFAPLIVSPSICQSRALRRRAARAERPLLGHLLQRICDSGGRALGSRWQCRKQQYVAGAFFFPRHLLLGTDCRAAAAAMLPPGPVMVVKPHHCADLRLFAWAKGKDALLLPSALCSRCPAELPRILDSGNPFLCCFVAWHSSPLVLIAK